MDVEPIEDQKTTSSDERGANQSPALNELQGGEGKGVDYEASLMTVPQDSASGHNR